MIRLMDQLLNDSPAWKNHRGSLGGAKLIVADNVADYFWRGTDQEMWDLNEDFPNIAPPFEQMFIEGKCPAYSLSKTEGTHPIEIDISGCYIMGFPYSDGLRRTIKAQVHKGRESLDRFDRPPKWLLTCIPVVRVRRTGEISYPQVLYNIYVDAQGRATRYFASPAEEVAYEMMAVNPDVDTPERIEQLKDFFWPCLCIALLTISFMHCRNVELEEVVPPKKLAKAHAKRTGLILHRYSVISITPMVSVLRAAATANGLSSRRALHICRGHFKDYRQRGLFGKYQGTFWWGQQARGTGPGIVESTYDVNPPPDSSQVTIPSPSPTTQEVPQ